MIKLQDFARENGVTDRAIQKHIKKYEAELEGLYERRGPDGTWLTDEACRFLKSKMKVNMVVLEENSHEIEELRNRIKELEDRIERKDIIIEKLQDRVDKREALIETMKEEQKLIEEQSSEQFAKAQLEMETVKKESLEKDGQIKALRDEVNSFVPGIFGLYRKKK